MVEGPLLDRRSALVAVGATSVLLSLGGYAAFSETSAQRQQDERRQAFHYPKAEGQPVPPRPYLTIPFSESGLRAAVANDPNFDQFVHPAEQALIRFGAKPRIMRITQGWEYDEREFQIGGERNHLALDIHAPRKTKVLFPADGYATSTYQTFWETNPDGSKRLYQGEPIRRGAGLVVQLYVPSDIAPPLGRFVQFFHLEQIESVPDDKARNIPFLDPVQEGEDWNPQRGHLTIPVADIPTNPHYVRVQRGQPLGEVGLSGLAWGDPNEALTIRRTESGIIITSSRSWDPANPHLHMEEFWRKQSTGAKEGWRDISSQYAQKDRYSRMSEPILVGPDSLWIVDSNRRAVFAAA